MFQLASNHAGFLLAQVKGWDVFGSPTFAGHVPSARRVHRMAFAHLRSAARMTGRRFDDLLWALRLEEGEVGGRLHFHYLLGDTFTRNARTLAHRLEYDWKRISGGARVEVREFDRAQAGAAYVSKALGVENAYEINKFGVADMVTVSAGVVRILANLSRRTKHAAACTLEQLGGR